MGDALLRLIINKVEFPRMMVAGMFISAATFYIFDIENRVMSHLYKEKN